MPNVSPFPPVIAAAALATWLFGSAFSEADAAGLRRFGHWAAGCDNTRHCRAVGWARTIRPDDPTFLIIDREAGPQGRVRIAGGGGFEPDKEIFIDGKPALKLEPDVFFASMEPFDIDHVAPLALAATDPAANDRLLDAALKGSALAFAADAQPEGLIPLDGLKGALLFMDEQQGRAGTATALVAKGPRPAGAVPPPVPAPQAIPAVAPLSKAPAEKAENEAVNAFHRASASRQLCDEKSFGSLWEITPSRVSPRQRLYEFYCREESSRGSRFRYLVYLVDEDAPQRIARARFERIDGAGGGLRLDADVTLRGGDLQDGNWIDQREGDESGDCREALMWRWDGQAFRLISHLFGPVCPNGVSDAPAIVLWRTREN